MAPHYEFFQRRTVHVNSRVLLSSTHPRAAPRRDFRTALAILQAVLNLRPESLVAEAEWAGECGCAGAASENPFPQTDMDCDHTGATGDFSAAVVLSLACAHCVALATLREISPRQFLFAPS